MVNSVLGVNHRGFTDWLIQRISAIVMIIYTFILIGFFYKHPQLAFTDWHDLFAEMWMKISTLIVLLFLLFHAWIGMWTILTDYVKPYVLRMTLHVIVFLALLAFFLQGILILWSV